MWCWCSAMAWGMTALGSWRRCGGGWECIDAPVVRVSWPLLRSRCIVERRPPTGCPPRSVTVDCRMRTRMQGTMVSRQGSPAPGLVNPRGTTTSTLLIRYRPRYRRPEMATARSANPPMPASTSCSAGKEEEGPCELLRPWGRWT
jgi:hypothetical protein